MQCQRRCLSAKTQESYISSKQQSSKTSCSDSAEALLDSHALLSVFDDVQLDAISLGQRDEWSFLSNNRDILQSGGKVVAFGVFQMDDFEGTRVLLTVGDNTNATDVVSARDHADISVLKLADTQDFSLLDVNADGVVDGDFRIGVTDGATVVGNDHGDSLSGLLNLLDTAQLVRSFLGGDLVNDETTLGVVQETKVFLSLLQANDIHEAGWESVVGADLAVNLD